MRRRLVGRERGRLKAAENPNSERGQGLAWVPPIIVRRQNSTSGIGLALLRRCEGAPITVQRRLSIANRPPFAYDNGGWFEGRRQIRKRVWCLLPR